MIGTGAPKAGPIHVAPGLRPQYSPTDDGAFVIDPDGHDVESRASHAGR